MELGSKTARSTQSSPPSTRADHPDLAWREAEARHVERIEDGAIALRARDGMANERAHLGLGMEDAAARSPDAQPEASSMFLTKALSQQR
jgi:hypothetical protein